MKSIQKWIGAMISVAFLTIVFTIGFAAIAQEAVPPVPTFMDPLLHLLGSLSSGWKSTIMGLVLEGAVRLWPTKNPLSLLIPAKYAVDALIVILQWVSGTVLAKAIKVANNAGG